MKLLQLSFKDLVKERETLEQQIYDEETAYLEETHLRGNLVKGWEGFLDR